MHTIICAYCGKEVEKKANSQKHCSDKCRERYKYERRQPKERNIQKNCEECKKEYCTNNPASRFCSKSCSTINWNKVKGRTLNLTECAICKVHYKPSKSNQKCCSKECGSKLAGRLASVKLMKFYECRCCGISFRPKRAHAQIYCSRECYNKHRSIDNAEHMAGKKSVWKHGLSDRRHRKRAEKYGVKAVRIVPLDIYIRDNWICQICGEKVDQSLRNPHPKSATIDHTLALSKGGTHEHHNVRLAHLRCNTMKLDGFAQESSGQLKMF